MKDREEQAAGGVCDCMARRRDARRLQKRTAYAAKRVAEREGFEEDKKFK